MPQKHEFVFFLNASNDKNYYLKSELFEDKLLLFKESHNKNSICTVCVLWQKACVRLLISLALPRAPEGKGDFCVRVADERREG